MHTHHHHHHRHHTYTHTHTHTHTHTPMQAVFDTLTNQDFISYIIVIFLTVFMFTLPFNLLWSGLLENYNTIASSYLRILDAMFEWELLVLDITSLPTDYYLHDSHGIFALSWLRFIFAAKTFYLLWMFVALVLMNLFIGESS